MNCTAIRIAASSHGVAPWDLTIVTVLTILMVFQLFCAYPVFKLARERFALYILVSKLFPEMLLLLAIITQHTTAYVPLTKITIFFFNYIVTSCAICNYFNTPAYYTGAYVIVSSFFYAAIVTKFAWIKAHNRSWSTEVAASASDKDSVRLTWTCVGIQILAMCQLSYISASNFKWFDDFMLCDPIGKMLFFPVQLFINLNYVADELFLLLLCKEMRTNCRQMIGKVWPFTTTKVAAIDAGLSTQIRNINANVVGSNRRWAAVQQL
uniref:Serpentine receptor class gamma n=1 Tax=Globodera rostochiensis TaxID=31243 RepID=A0A914HIM1_GLORO